MQTLNGHGCVWYRTRLAPGRAQELIVTAAHDYLLGWVGGKPLGIIDRSRGQQSLWLPERNESQTLDLLVEAMGHVNFGSSMGERKGITEKVELRDDLGRREILDWEIFPVPLEPVDLAALRFEKLGVTPQPEPRENPQPAVYRSSFQLDKTGDTFLDLRGWSKGMVWVNGNNLGRYWGIGPQQTLYVPGPWLRVGRNEVLIVDLLGPKSAQVRGLSEPVLTELNLASDGRVHQRAGQTLHLEGTSPQYAGIWGPETSWQTRRFEPIRGRYVCFESLSSHPGDGFSTCAELGFLDAAGRELPKTGWKVVYANSEESSQEDGGADRMFDGVPGTFWHSGWHPTKELPPHRVVVDLGRSQVVSGIQYLPRQDQANGRIRDFHLYASEKPFLVTE